MISWINQLGETEPAAATAEPLESQESMEWLPEVESPQAEAEGAPVETTPSIITPPEAPAGKAGELSQARQALGSGDVITALDAYNGLINSNEMVDETIHDLNEATSRYPTDVMVWQTLGDAYIRANRVQEALDAYTKAEELLH
jgi:tetratricopeptide (TPR) repeat protein